MRRRLQESFHLSPAAAVSANGGTGFFSSAFGTSAAHHHNHQIPTISVSVQTEPSMVNMNGNGPGSNGLANTAALLGKSKASCQNIKEIRGKSLLELWVTPFLQD